MTDILGYDVNGEPLRAGDRVVYVGLVKQPYANGHEATVVSCIAATGKLWVFDGLDDGRDIVSPINVRKIKDDSQSKDCYTDQHVPCGLSFGELVEGFKGVTA